MPAETINLRFTLRFATKPSLELRATEFHLPRTPTGPVTLRCSEGKAGDGHFEWREGSQALCICLLRYLCDLPEVLAKGMKFVFEGARESPAKTLFEAIAKANKANCWQINMFGHDADGTCRLRRLITRRTPNPKVKPRKYELEIQHEQLPQAGILIEVDNQPVTKIEALSRLAEDIEDLWYASKPRYEEQWAKVKEARKQRAKTLASQQAEPVIEHAKKPDEPKKGEMKKVGETKSLAELFKSLPVTSIISHITVAMLPARGNDTVEKFSAEILSTECINVLAEKVVSESINDFCDFFCAKFDPPHESLPLVPDELNPKKIKDLRFAGPPVPDIKKCVGVFIASNGDLRTRLAAKVARCDFSDMSYWFIALSCCHERRSEREIVLAVERALNAAAEEPGFKEKFLLYAPKRLPTLIKYFSDYDCVVAARLLRKINQEGGDEEMRIDRILHGDSGIEKS